MKTIKIVLVNIILSLFFTGCEKDVRDKYVGDWNFVTIEEIYRGGESSRDLIRIDTVYYAGTIKYGNFEYGGDGLLIQCTEQDSIPVIVTKKGVIWQAFPTKYGTCYQCSLGSFEKSGKVSLDFNRYLVEGFTIIFHVSGVKKRGDKK